MVQRSFPAVCNQALTPFLEREMGDKLLLSVHKGESIYVEVVDQEPVQEHKRRRSCLAEPVDYASHVQLPSMIPLAGRQTTGLGGSYPVPPGG